MSPYEIALSAAQAGKTAQKLLKQVVKDREPPSSQCIRARGAVDETLLPDGVPVMTQPDYIGIGVGKSGTTWIYDILAAHPNIGVSPIKELNFFSSKYPYFEKGVNWYEQFFQKDHVSVTGEFSVTYAHDEIALKRISELYPSAKIILAIRHPIDRAISQYMHDIRKGTIKKYCRFEDYIDSNYNLSDGAVEEIIQKCKRTLKHNDVFLVPFDSIKNRPEHTVLKIYEFLNVDKSFSPQILKMPSNKGFIPKWQFVERVLSRGAYHLTTNGHVKFLWLLKRFQVHSIIRHLNSLTLRPRIGAEISEKLAAHYQRDIIIYNRILNKF